MGKLEIDRERLPAFRRAMLEQFPGVAAYHIDEAIAQFFGFDDGDALKAAFQRGKGTIIVPELFPERCNYCLRESPNYPWINPREPLDSPSNRGKRSPPIELALRGVAALQRLVNRDLDSDKAD